MYNLWKVIVSNHSNHFGCEFGFSFPEFFQKLLQFLHCVVAEFLFRKGLRDDLADLVEGLPMFDYFFLLEFLEVESCLLDGKIAQAEGELFHLAEDVLHVLAVEERSLFVSLLRLGDGEGDRVLLQLPDHVQLGGVGLEELGLVAGYPVHEAVRSSCSHDCFLGLAGEVEHSEHVLFHSCCLE